MKDSEHAPWSMNSNEAVVTTLLVLGVVALLILGVRVVFF